MMRVDISPWRRWVAWAATVLAAWLLFWPFAHDETKRRVEGFDKAVHAGLFGGLAWAWGRAQGVDFPGLERRRRRWKLAGVLAGATLAVEVLQPLTGRDFDWVDAAAGSAGIVATTLLWDAGFAWMAAVLCVLGVGFMAKGLWNLGTEWREFPVLASGGRACWEGDWDLRGVSAEQTADGLRLVPLPEGPETWRGVFRVPARSDWSGCGDWTLRVEWGGEDEATLVVRLDDRRGAQPAYADRFQREWRVARGWNELVIPRGEWSRTSGGGALDASDIAHWGVFLLEPADFDHWTLGKTELKLLEERTPS